jgi:pilus assembly protein CpaB
MDALRGSYLKVDLEANSTILKDDIIRPGEPGFIVAALQPGMRAVSMAVNEVSGVSGFIAPGNRVDLLLTHSIEDLSENPIFTPRRYSETILQDLRLLAIGQEPGFSSSGAPTTGDGPSAGGAGETVTLEVTPNQAEAVNVAASMGTLSLALRPIPLGNTGVDNNSQKNTLTSDVSISPAIANWVFLGGTSTKAEAADKPKNLVVIYRAGTPSTVVVKR